MKKFDDLAEKIDGESDKSPARKYKSLDSTTSAARKPVNVTVNGKKVVKMVPVKQDVTTEETIAEESPMQAAKNWIGKKVRSKNYDAAHNDMMKHGLSAADAAKRYVGVDARTLQKMHDDMKESVEVEESARGLAVDAKAHEMGKKAARQGASYGDNPFDRGSSKHLAWSKGHNKARAAMKESVEVEEGYRNIMTTHDGETFKSKLFTNKKDSDDHHWKMTKATDKRGKKIYKKIETVKEAIELEEAKATYCGRCGTTHVPPKDGGTCPALKKEGMSFKQLRGKLEEGMFDREKRAFKRKEHEAEYKRDQEIERAKKQKASEPHHVYINGKVWKKDGKPVHFANKSHANKAALTIQKKDPSKSVKLVHHAYTERNGGVIK